MGHIIEKNSPSVFSATIDLEVVNHHLLCKMFLTKEVKDTGLRERESVYYKCVLSPNASHRDHTEDTQELSAVTGWGADKVYTYLAL